MKDDIYFRNVKELEPAERYLFGSKVAVLGRSQHLSAVINQIKMPPLPLLMSNIDQRRAMQKRGVISSLVKGAHIRIDNMHKVIADAIEQEKQKPFFTSLYYTEDVAPHEQLTLEPPLTMQQFKQLCNEQ